VSSSLVLRRSIPVTARGVRTAFTAIPILAFALFAFAAPVGAKSVYGGDSAYGTAAFSTEATDPAAQSGQPSSVNPPNTGFAALEQLQRVASAQPVFFWGSVSAIGIAVATGAFAARQIIKRKQEN
jgi:hypothetical protein